LLRTSEAIDLGALSAPGFYRGPMSPGHGFEKIKIKTKKLKKKHSFPPPDQGDDHDQHRQQHDHQ
jgi:hypothetical protein